MGVIQKLKIRAQRLTADILALSLAFKRKDTPFLAKAMIAITVCYALSPIDLIPDFIPVLGFLDDVLLLPLLIVLAIKLIPPRILTECREQANDVWGNGNSKRFRYALPVIAIWAILIVIIVKAIWF